MAEEPMIMEMWIRISFSPYLFENELQCYYSLEKTEYQDIDNQGWVAYGLLQVQNYHIWDTGKCC